MIFTQKIFENKTDSSVHEQFVRFSKGTFENRALMKITMAKDSFKLNASYDLIKDIILVIAENFNNIEVNGKVFHEKKKQEINKTISGQELKKICEENTFILLNLSFENYDLKVGKSLPKPGKELKSDFCKCVLPLTLLKEFINEKNFKKAEISYTFIIEEIEIPKQYQNDFALARKMAIRKGKIIKFKDIDGKKETSETKFSV